MAWVAKILSITDDVASPNVQIRVEFADGGRIVEEVFNLEAAKYPNLTSFRSFLTKRIADLSAFDTAVSYLRPEVGRNQ